MELRRRGEWAFPVLLIWASVLSVLAGSHDSNAVVESLNCINDSIDRISCDIKAPNCSQYKLLFVKDNQKKKTNKQKKNRSMHCKQNADHQCGCYPNPPNKILRINDKNPTVRLLKGDEHVGSKQISIIAGIKPRVPKIESIRNSNGIFEILWKSNMEGHPIDSYLSASVTLFKKGEIKKTSVDVTPTLQDNLKVYQIPSKYLEPSTTYVVCVRSFSEWSGRYSDCSAEMEFTTSMSAGSLNLIIILSFSVAAVLISSIAYICFVKIKTSWWDTIPKPSPLLMNLSGQKSLKPSLAVLSLVHVEPLMTEDSKLWFKESVILAGDPPSASTGTSPASTRFPHLSDSGLCSSPSNLCVQADDVPFGLCDFENKSYSIVLPGFPPPEERSEAQGELICDPAYRGADGDSDGQQLLERLRLTSELLPLMDTDMSYQVTKADSVSDPNVGDSRRSSISRGTMTPCDSSSGLGLQFDDVDRDAAKMDHSGQTVSGGEENLFCRVGSSSPLPVDFSYQSFQSLVEPSAALTLEKSRGEKRLSGYPDGPPGVTSEHISHPAVSCCPDNADAGPAGPLFSLLSANQAPSILVDSDYHRV